MCVCARFFRRFVVPGGSIGANNRKPDGKRNAGKHSIYIFNQHPGYDIWKNRTATEREKGARLSVLAQLLDLVGNWTEK